MICCICKGPAHPATGAQYSATAIACGPCTRDFWRWVKTHTSRKWGKVYFYECATKGKR